MKVMRPNFRAVLAAVAALTMLAACSGGDDPAQVSAASGDFERGPNNGRLLRDGDFAVEITIFEEGVPPEFHVYAYRENKPMDPAGVQLTIELGRLGGKTDRFGFEPQGDYLRSDGVVKEPHSFDVKVAARHDGKTSTWNYASYEGRVEIDAAEAEAANLRVESAGPGTIRDQLFLTGSMRANPARIARVRARFPGMVREVRKGLGDPVGAGQVLATVQSNESLQTYSVTAPIDGSVLVRSAVSGEATSEEPLFIVGDLSKIWVELDVFGSDINKVKAGQLARVVSLDDQTTAQGVIAAIAPLTTHSSQSVRARIVLDNDEGTWRPGQFVHGQITVAETKVPLAVKNAALQRFRDFTVVFAQVGDVYEVRMLELGRTDGTWTEVLGGLEPGERYVTENSFLVKADIEKSGASHDH